MAKPIIDCDFIIPEDYVIPYLMGRDPNCGIRYNSENDEYNIRMNQMISGDRRIGYIILESTLIVKMNDYTIGSCFLVFSYDKKIFYNYQLIDYKDVMLNKRNTFFFTMRSIISVYSYEMRDIEFLDARISVVQTQVSVIAGSKLGFLFDNTSKELMSTFIKDNVIDLYAMYYQVFTSTSTYNAYLKYCNYCVFIFQENFESNLFCFISGYNQYKAGISMSKRFRGLFNVSRQEIVISEMDLISRDLIKVTESVDLLRKEFECIRQEIIDSRLLELEKMYQTSKIVNSRIGWLNVPSFGAFSKARSIVCSNEGTLYINGFIGGVVMKMNYKYLLSSNITVDIKLFVKKDAKCVRYSEKSLSKIESVDSKEFIIQSGIVEYCTFTNDAEMIISDVIYYIESGPFVYL